MRATITLSLDVDSIQKLTAIRDKLIERLDADDEVTVVAGASAPHDEPFTVVGSFRGRPDERYDTVVRAPNREAAIAEVLSIDETRTVVAVFAGVHEIEPPPPEPLPSPEPEPEPPPPEPEPPPP